MRVPSRAGGLVRATGQSAIEFVRYAGGIALLGARAFAGLARPSVKHRSLVAHMLEIGVKTLPVSGIIVFLIGVVIAFQTAYQVRDLGGEVLIPGLLVVSITRELGPVMTALVVAGRVGAAITAELGSMAVTEQIDAIDAMAVRPVDYLVVPRLRAMLLVAPLLTLQTDLLGVLGGYAVCVGKMGLTHDYFVTAVQRALDFGDVFSGLLKSVIFGAAICVVSCFEGMNVAGGAQGVGGATMRSVVVSFILIVVADFVFTMLFYLVPF